jgi:hypothetical protein
MNEKHFSALPDVKIDLDNLPNQISSNKKGQTLSPKDI